MELRSCQKGVCELTCRRQFVTCAEFQLGSWEDFISQRPAVICVDAKNIYAHLSKPTVSVGQDK